MATPEELWDLVRERHETLNRLMGTVRKARREGHSPRGPLHQATRVAGLLADALKELVSVPE